VRLLLDTHAWVWQLLEPERLSGAAAAAIDDPANELFLSPISVWETLVLGRKGRLRLAPEPATWVRDALAVSPVTMVSVTHAIALRSDGLAGYEHQDPADRFLIASALVEQMTLVTRDSRIRRYRGVPTLW
jgi:PIN domain nuclease of toxin-antitoxin system